MLIISLATPFRVFLRQNSLPAEGQKQNKKNARRSDSNRKPSKLSDKNSYPLCHGEVHYGYVSIFSCIQTKHVSFRRKRRCQRAAAQRADEQRPKKRRRPSLDGFVATRAYYFRMFFLAQSCNSKGTRNLERAKCGLAKSPRDAQVPLRARDEQRQKNAAAPPSLASLPRELVILECFFSRNLVTLRALGI